MANPIASATLKLGARKDVKSFVEKVIGLIAEGYSKNTGQNIPPKLVSFLTAFIWAWIDFIDEASVRRGKIDAKDAGLFAVKKALNAVGMLEGEYAECGVAFASAIVSLVDNWGVIANTGRMAVAAGPTPLGGALALVSLGASIAVGLDFLNAYQKCEPLINKMINKDTLHESKKQLVIIYNHQNMCSVDDADNISTEANMSSASTRM
jgi:hypothetical protein